MGKGTVGRLTWWGVVCSPYFVGCQLRCSARSEPPTLPPGDPLCACAPQASRAPQPRRQTTPPRDALASMTRSACVDMWWWWGAHHPVQLSCNSSVSGSTNRNVVLLHLPSTFLSFFLARPLNTTTSTPPAPVKGDYRHAWEAARLDAEARAGCASYPYLGL